jgi:NADH:ubiquinone oxidoreductase subunit F (NADH-binding)
MFGLPEMAGLLERIASGDPDRRLAHELAGVSESVVGRGSCHHPNGTTRLVLSALNAFSPDVQAHLTGRCVRRASR